MNVLILYYPCSCLSREKIKKNIESFIPLCFSEYIYERTTKMQMFYLDSSISKFVCQEKNKKNIESGNSLYFWRCNVYKAKQNVFMHLYSNITKIVCQEKFWTFFCFRKKKVILDWHSNMGMEYKIACILQVCNYIIPTVQRFVKNKIIEKILKICKNFCWQDKRYMVRYRQ